MDMKDQLTAHGIGERISGDMAALGTSMATITNTFILATTALWAIIVVVLKRESESSYWLAIPLLLFGVIISIMIFQIIASFRYAIILRHNFLNEFQVKFYPSIKEIGDMSFRLTYGGKWTRKARYFRWAQPTVLWLFIPTITGFISLIALGLCLLRSFGGNPHGIVDDFFCFFQTL